MRTEVPTLVPITATDPTGRTATKLGRDSAGNLDNPKGLGIINFTLPAEFRAPIFPLLDNERLRSAEDYFGQGYRPLDQSPYHFLKLGHLYVVWHSDCLLSTTLYVISERERTAELTPLLTSQKCSIDKILGLPLAFFVSTTFTCSIFPTTPPLTLSPTDKARLDLLLKELMSGTESPENHEELRRLFRLLLPTVTIYEAGTALRSGLSPEGTAANAGAGSATATDLASEDPTPPPLAGVATTAAAGAGAAPAPTAAGAGAPAAPAPTTALTATAAASAGASAAPASAVSTAAAAGAGTDYLSLLTSSLSSSFFNLFNPSSAPAGTSNTTAVAPTVAPTASNGSAPR